MTHVLLGTTYSGARESQLNEGRPTRQNKGILGWSIRATKVNLSWCEGGRSNERWDLGESKRKVVVLGASIP